MWVHSSNSVVLSYLLAVAVCAAGSSHAVDAGKDVSRPNILFILIDDLGHEAIGAYGGVSYETPNIDALAEAGVRFTHAYSTPLCSPSRVQLMTGRYGHRNYTEWGILPPDEITFANLLRDAGYATFVAGKWQLWGHELLWPVEEPCCLHEGQTPTDAGFDDYLVWYLGSKGPRYADPELSTREEDSEVYRGRYGPDLLADFIAQSMKAQVRENPNQPFFGYYSMVLDHAPFVPTPDSADWQNDRERQDPAYFEDMVAYTDKLVGRLLMTLDDLGIRDDTLVVLTADNGTPSGIESRMADGRVVVGDKGRTTDGGTRVPLIVSWPGTIEGDRVSDALVDFTDFLPSFVEVGGATLPRDRTIDGHSMLPILNGRQAEIRDWVFTDYRSGHPCCPGAAYVRDRRFKLYEDGRFYDIANDVLESEPLTAAAMQGEAKAANAALGRVLDRMRAPSPR
jgi:arylsulfatase A